MSIFALIVEKDGVKHLNSIKERFKETNIVKNPFVFKTQPIFYKDNKDIINADIISIGPVYPNVVIYLLIIALAGFVITLNIFFFVVVMISGILSLFWYKPFYIFMFKWALRKRGYKGPIKILNPGEIIEKVYFYGTN